MALVANFAVTGTAQKVISGAANCRGVNVTNNGVGTGNVFFQVVDRLPIPGQSGSNLTTANGTKLAFQPNPARINLTPGYAASSFNTTTTGTSDDSDGFDLWVISDGTAQINVQTIPF